MFLQGPAVFYVDSDGTRLKGDLFSVGSGSTFAYGVLDQGYRWDLTDEEAQELGRRSIYAAGHRDAFSGNTINLFHVKENGWQFIGKSKMSRYNFIVDLRYFKATTTSRRCTTMGQTTSQMAATAGYAQLHVQQSMHIHGVRCTERMGMSEFEHVHGDQY